MRKSKRKKDFWEMGDPSERDGGAVALTFHIRKENAERAVQSTRKRRNQETNPDISRQPAAVKRHKMK
jgi:hypothetical protein